MAPNDCGDGDSVDVFFEWWVKLYFYGELMLLYGMDMEFKNKIMLYCFREVKYQQDFTRG